MIPYEILVAALATLLIILDKMGEVSIKGTSPLPINSKYRNWLIGAFYLLAGFYWGQSIFIFTKSWYAITTGIIISIFCLMYFLSTLGKPTETNENEKQQEPENNDAVSYTSYTSSLIGKTGKILYELKSNCEHGYTYQYVGILDDTKDSIIISTDSQFSESESFVINRIDGQWIVAIK